MQDLSSHHVLITGITGRVGSLLTQELLGRGARVRGLVMPSDSLRARIPREVATMSGDLGVMVALEAVVILIPAT